MSWTTDHPVTPDLVRALLAAQLPGLAGARVEYLAEGWDNVVYEVDGTWLLRFPKRAEVEPSLAVELALLPAIAPRLPLAVPRYELRGEPSDLYPRRFAGYRRLPGSAASSLEPTPDQLPRFAAQLGGFLAALHAIPVEEAARLGVPGNTGNRSLTRLRARVAAGLGALRTGAPAHVARVERFLATPPPPPFDGAPRLIHADLYSAHVLLEGARITGIIDWADVELGDPAVDLCGLLHWAGEPLLRLVLERYPFADPGLVDRARDMAICLSCFDVVYGVETGRPANVALGARGLELNLPAD
jgi:aminoglycoside phosphotransferase (APT) family kinase protein